MPNTFNCSSKRILKKLEHVKRYKKLCSSENLPHNNPVDTHINVDSNGSVTINIELNGLQIPYYLKGLSKSPLEASTQNIIKITKKPYVVSLKLDGDYTIIYIDNNGICYYVFKYTNRMFRFGSCSNKKFYKTAYSSEYMYMDKYGRIFNNEGYLIQRNIVLFDILYSSNGNISNILKDRMKYCNDMISSLTYNETYFTDISTKKYYDVESNNDNIYKMFSII